MSKTDKMPTQSLCAGRVTAPRALGNYAKEQSFWHSWLWWKPFVFFPAQLLLLLLLDEREQLLLTIAFQYAVQVLGVTNPKHVLFQPVGPSPGPSQLYISEQLLPSVMERWPMAALYAAFDIKNENVSIKLTHRKSCFSTIAFAHTMEAAEHCWAVICLAGARNCSNHCHVGLWPAEGCSHVTILRPDHKWISESLLSV